MTMDLSEITTTNLLRMLVDENERRETWERTSARRSHHIYDDAVLLDDIIRTLAARIDGKERGPQS